MDGCTIESDINKITLLLDGLSVRLITELDSEQRKQAGEEVIKIEQSLKRIKEICQQTNNK